MNELDDLYLEMLRRGMIVLKHAILIDDTKWAEAEIELLMNIPTLINEKEVGIHQYFWNATRKRYLDWMSKSGSEIARSRMRMYYDPLWSQMEPFIMSSEK